MLLFINSIQKQNNKMERVELKYLNCLMRKISNISMISNKII